MSIAIKESARLKILVVGGNSENAQIIDDVLKQNGFSFLLKTADSRGEFIGALAKFTPDVILTDEDGQVEVKEALALARESNTGTSFIIMISTETKDYVPPFGADGYIIKSNFDQLPSAVRSSLIRHKVDARDELAKLQVKNKQYLKTINELDHLIFVLAKTLSSSIETIPALGVNSAHSPSNSNENQPTVSEDVRLLQVTAEQITQYSEMYGRTFQHQEIEWSELVNDVINDVLPDKEQKAIVKRNIKTAAPFFSDHERLKLLLRHMLIVVTQAKRITKFSLSMSIHTQAGHAIVVFATGDSLVENELTLVSNSYLSKPDLGISRNLSLTIAREVVSRLGGTLTVSHHEEIGMGIKVNIPNTLPR